MLLKTFFLCRTTNTHLHVNENQKVFRFISIISQVPKLFHWSYTVTAMFRQIMSVISTRNRYQDRDEISFFCARTKKDWSYKMAWFIATMRNVQTILFNVRNVTQWFEFIHVCISPVTFVTEQRNLQVCRNLYCLRHFDEEQVCTNSYI